MLRYAYIAYLVHVKHDGDHNNHWDFFLSIYLPGSITAVAVIRKPNAIPLCFSTDLDLNFSLSWLRVLLPFMFFADVLFFASSLVPIRKLISVFTPLASSCDVATGISSSVNNESWSFREVWIITALQKKKNQSEMWKFITSKNSSGVQCLQQRIWLISLHAFCAGTWHLTQRL
jgi:hypothetical protein